jgi:hypothetical protein
VIAAVNIGLAQGLTHLLAVPTRSKKRFQNILMRSSIDCGFLKANQRLKSSGRVEDAAAIFMMLDSKR